MLKRRRRKSPWLFVPWPLLATLAIVLLSLGFGVRHSRAQFSGTPIEFPLLGAGVGMSMISIAAMREQRRRKRLLMIGASLTSIRRMSWKEFELLVGAAFRQRGFVVEEVGQGGADGGVDLIARKNGKTILVQCKHWRSNRVGVSVIREMFGLMHHMRAASVAVVTTGDFTRDAWSFVHGKPVELISGVRLVEMIRDGKG